MKWSVALKNHIIQTASQKYLVQYYEHDLKEYEK